MKLYTKGERRYTEAKRSDIIAAASSILHEMDPDIGAALRGIAMYLSYEERTAVATETKTIAAQKEKPL